MVRLAWSVWLVVALTAAVVLPRSVGATGVDVAAHAAWPGVGLCAALFVLAGDQHRWRMLGLQVGVVGVAVLVVGGAPWWVPALTASSLALPGLMAAVMLRPPTAAFRRFNEDEPDAYHGVTALAGVLCGLLSALAAATSGVDARQVGLVGLTAFFSSTTAQLVVLPFVMRRAGGWASLGGGVELAAQRVMLVVFSLAVFLPGSALPVAFVLFPILGWAAIRAQAAETHIQVGLVSLLAFVSTLLGRGPFAVGGASDPSVWSPLLVFAYSASICYLLVPLALTVERLFAVTRQATAAAATVQRMLDSATGTVFIATDPSGRITHCNAGTEAALGYRAEELIGDHPARFHDPEEIVRHARHFGVEADSLLQLFTATVTAQVISGERRDWEFIRADQTRCLVSLNIGAMTTSDGRLSGLIASGEDITERVRAQQALERAFDRERVSTRALRDANAVKQELVSTVSHELRTPITSIMGFAEVLVDGQLGEINQAQQEALGRIERNTVRLRRLVDDLLTLSTAESGALEVRSTRVDLRDVVRDVEQLLAPELRARHLTITVTLDPAPVVVRGDRELLERVVMNLWSNAVKFTPDGGCVIVEVTRQDALGGSTADDASVDASASRRGAALPAEGLPGTTPHLGYGQVRVTDTGVGIPETDHDQVFTRFHRAPVAGELAIQGSGLGLSIVRTIVDHHDGHITLQSVPDVGTEIAVGFPLAGSDDRAMESDGHGLAGGVKDTVASP